MVYVAAYNQNYRYQFEISMFIQGDSNWLPLAYRSAELENIFETHIFLEIEIIHAIILVFFAASEDTMIKNSFEYVAFTGAPPYSKEDFLSKS